MLILASMSLHAALIDVLNGGLIHQKQGNIMEIADEIARQRVLVKEALRKIHATALIYGKLIYIDESEINVVEAKNINVEEIKLTWGNCSYTYDPELNGLSDEENDIMINKLLNGFYRAEKITIA